VSGFASRDPGLPAFWDERFEAGFTPWDAGAPPPAFLRFLGGGAIAPGARVLVPGCGSAWEVAAMDDAGLSVLAIDFSPAALARARAQLGPRAQDLLRQADFFDFTESSFDWIYERTFLPALPPTRWMDWARRMAQLAAPGALLAGFFLIDPTVDATNRRGPPFAIRRDELDALLAQDFDCIGQQAVPPGESVPVLAGREHWIEWRRR